MLPITYRSPGIPLPCQHCRNQHRVQLTNMADKSTTEYLKENSSYFPFISLPRELRDQIYSHALQGTPHEGQDYYSRVMCPGSELHVYASLSCKTNSNFNLLLCSKQIYEETIDLVYELNHFELELINFTLPASIDHWPFWTRVKHLDVHVCVEDSWSLSALTQILLNRGGNITLHRVYLVSSMRRGILDELEELAGLKAHGPVTVHVDTTADEHAAVKDSLGPILTKMIGKDSTCTKLEEKADICQGNVDVEIEVQAHGTFKVDAFSRLCCV